MKLKKKLVLLSLQMILSGFIADYVSSLLLRLAFLEKGTPYRTAFLLDRILCKARLSFNNAEKAYQILLYYHTDGALLTEQQ